MEVAHRYPIVKLRPATLPRSYGVCALSDPHHPHEGELDGATGICAKDLAYLYRDPFEIRRSRRTWRQSLAHWWRSYSWIGAGLAALAAGLFFTGLVAAFVLLAFWRHGVIG